MPTRKLFCILTALLFIPFAGEGHFFRYHVPGQSRTYYVLAPSGLNLRKEAKASSQKLTNIPYGAQVELITVPEECSMLVDQIPGGMAYISFDGLTGYAFDGYLSRFPAPEPGMLVETYVEKIRDAGYETLFEEINRDWGGYLQAEDAFILNGKNFPEAFLIAVQLFEIPPGLLFPLESNDKKVVIENPAKEESVWTDELTIVRQENGELESITYGFRTDGFGHSVMISYSKDEGGLRISKISMAD